MPKKIEMLSGTFNYWTVLKQGKNNGFNKTTWLCRCKCGIEREVEGKSLRNGTSKSCGCKPKHELSGRKFGNWSVVKFSDNKNGKGARWECICKCGTKRIVHSSDLLRGDSRSCGCSSLNAKKDLTGKSFGHWTVLSESGKNKFGQILWSCLCVCGAQRLSSPVKTLLQDLKLKSDGSLYVLPRLQDWDTGRQAEILRMFLSSIGLPRIRFHDLRASWATMLLSKGLEPAKVMKLGGWKDLKTMMIYLRKAGIDTRGSLSEFTIHDGSLKKGEVLQLKPSICSGS